MATRKISTAQRGSAIGGNTSNLAGPTVLEGSTKTVKGGKVNVFDIGCNAQVNNLQFVNGLCNGYRSKETRSHVMKQAYREKRRRVERGENNDPPRSWPVVIDSIDRGPLKTSYNDNAEIKWTPGLPAAPNTLEGVSSTKRAKACSLTNSDDGSENESGVEGFVADRQLQERKVANWISARPQTMLGAGRVNPFSTYPVQHLKRTDQLVDFYVNVDRVLSHGCPVVNETEYNFHKDRVRAVQENECSFYAMLVLSANRQATLCNDNTSCDAMNFKQDALRAINQSLIKHQETGEPLHDGVLLAVVDLADDELRFGSRERALTHWHGLAEMINQRGGLSQLVHNRLLQAVLIWYHMCLGFSQGLLWPSLPVERRMTLPPSMETRQRFERVNLQDDYEALVNFLQKLENTTLEYPASDLFGVSCQGTTRSKLAVFGPGTVVHGILMSNNDLPSLGEAFTNQESSIRSKHSCLLPSLLYLCAALMEHVEDDVRLWDFIVCLNEVICENNLHFLKNHDKFLLLLLRGVERPADRRPERAWLVMRLMSAVRRLGHVSRQRVGVVLQGALGMYGSYHGYFAAEWDPEFFRQEIFATQSDCD